ncbi:DHHW family protein [Ruminococcus sp.]|uniref:DHHW family protein n=1 Tax=Ruminococcus sp. TaxID=41978 RepID=UPI0025FC72EE|nr:DHHW family protein [Ruminococcus sp.]MCI6615696.1 DHHW family protein [Ruminococcus sp.]
MSKRNDYDYFDLDNFDDGYDSRDYRRRQPQRRQGSYNSRPAYNTNRRRRNNKKRTRNRIIIVSCGILIIILLVVMISSVFKGCFGSKQTNAPVSTETKPVATADTPKANDKKNEAQDDLSPTYFKTPQIKDDKSSGYSAYSIYVWNKQGFELFGSDEARATTYAETINGFADKLNGITVYDMVIPNHTEMGLPQRLKDSDAPSTSQAENIKSIYSKLSDKVTPVNAYNYLADHNDEYIYFGSDHHWSGLGAYYAYSAFAKTNDLPVLSLDDCTEQQIEGFTGTFSNTASGLDTDTVHYWEFPYEVTMDITDESGNLNTYTSPYYQYAEAGSLTYGVFIMGDHPLTVLKSASENAEEGKKIAVIKESYGNAFVPYLTYNYEEVHVIDFRTFGDNLVSYCQQNGIDEVLFLNGVMSANTQIQLDSMSGLFD